MAGAFKGKVIIIGGGIGGLATAVALRKVGIAADVYERAPEIQEVGAGVGLWPNALVALRRLGLEEQVTRLGATSRYMDTYTTNGRHLSTTNLDLIRQKAGAPLLMIHRARLHRTLAQALPRETIHTASECVTVHEDENGVTARFADGSTVQGDLLIGADGIRSVVRSALFGAREPRYAGYSGWRGIRLLRGTEMPDDRAWFALGSGTQMGFFPCGGDQIYWFVAQNAPPHIIDPPNEKKQAVLSVAPSLHPMFRQIIETTEESAIIKNDIFDRPPIRNWGSGRITLLGDAAHPTTPNMGMGACQAIEDAVFLAHGLSQKDDLGEALRYYQHARRRRASLVTRQSWWIGKAFQLQNPLAVALRNLGMKWFGGSRRALKSAERLWTPAIPHLEEAE